MLANVRAYGETLMRALKSLVLSILITGGWIIVAYADDKSDCRVARTSNLRSKGARR
jgi:hypothetical protein